MLLFSGDVFYPISKRVLDHWSIISRSWHVANYVLNPTVQFYIQICVFLVGVVARCFGTPFGELVFKCWASSLHFGDPLEGINFMFISDLISILMCISESLNISIDMQLRS